ncbi:MAG: hypothetical protein ACE10G_07385 [Gemmatimonadales bacterium]
MTEGRNELSVFPWEGRERCGIPSFREGDGSGVAFRLSVGGTGVVWDSVLP